MKKITLFSFLIVIAFAACRKENVIVTPTPVTPTLKKIEKITNQSIDINGADILNTSKYSYNVNGTIKRADFYFNATNPQNVADDAVNYIYKSGLLEMQNKDNKIIALCYLNTDGFVAIDSSGNDYSVSTYDSNKYKIKDEHYTKGNKKLESVSTYKYENDRLISTSRTHYFLKDKTLYEVIYTYDKDILNTFDDAYFGTFFLGKHSKYLHTKSVATITNYVGQTNNISSVAKYESNFTYEINAEGYVTKQTEKFLDDNTETVTTYIYK